MTIKRMHHVGVVVDDLDAAKAFFLELGFGVQGEGTVGGEWAGRVIGLEDPRVDMAMVETPDGHARLELIKFHNPPSEDGKADAPANARGIRHLTFEVDDVDAAVAGLRRHGAELVGEVVRYGDTYRVCYVRGPEGIIVELGEPLGG